MKFFNVLTSPELLETTEALLPEHRERLYPPMVTLSMFMRQVLITTMADHRRISKRDLSALHARRWKVELDLRKLKTTTGMNVLSCQTPQMNDKQLWVHLLAYNVIRLLMAQAACHAGIDPRDLSFKHTVQLWTEWVCRGLSATNDCGRLFALIAQGKVGHRCGRIEPRMRKRRFKPYPWLKVPSAQARQQVQTHGHAKKTKQVPFGLGVGVGSRSYRPRQTRSAA